MAVTPKDKAEAGAKMNALDTVVAELEAIKNQIDTIPVIVDRKGNSDDFKKMIEQLTKISKIRDVQPGDPTAFRDMKGAIIGVLAHRATVKDLQTDLQELTKKKEEAMKRVEKAIKGLGVTKDFIGRNLANL